MNDFLSTKLFDDTYQYLPENVKTRDGAKFDPRLDLWAYRDSMLDIYLNFDKLHAQRGLINSSKKVLIWYAENMSAPHLRNMFYYFSHFLRVVSSDQNKVSKINTIDIINYRDKLVVNNEYYLGNLSGFFQKWHSLGVTGVSDETVELLKQLRLKSNRKGVAVSTMDSLHGPFTDLEVEALHAAIEAEFQLGHVNLDDYILIWLFLALGQRPIQYASLKVCDFVTSAAKDGNTIYTLNVPRAKQRGQLSRAVFRQRVLVQPIGEKLVKYIEDVKSLDFPSENEQY